MLGFLILERVRLDRYSKWENWSTRLFLSVTFLGAFESSPYFTVCPVHHLLHWQRSPVYGCRCPPYWQAQKYYNSPEGDQDQVSKPYAFRLFRRRLFPGRRGIGSFGGRKLVTCTLLNRFLCFWNPLRCRHSDNVVRKVSELVARLSVFQSAVPTRDHTIYS
jgi:hypothetical protein